MDALSKRLRASSSSLLNRQCTPLKQKRCRQSVAVTPSNANHAHCTDVDRMSVDVNAMSDNELRFRLRLVEAENRRLVACQGRVMADSARKVEMHLNEIRLLREEVRRLNVENRELRDLSCFLDEERNRAKKLSREWQRFGRYTNSLMKQELTAHQQKVAELAEHNRQLSRGNDELKQLCLYLDDQRNCMTTSRCQPPEGPGSSSSGASCSGSGSGHEAHDDEVATASSGHKTTGDSPDDSGHCSTPAASPGLPAQHDPGHERSLPPIEEHHEHLLTYIRSLESRVNSLEQRQPPATAAGGAVDQQTMTTSMTASMCSSVGTVHGSSQSASNTLASVASSSASQQTMVFAVNDDTDVEDAGEYDLSPIREEPAEVEDSPVKHYDRPASSVCQRVGLFMQRGSRTRLSLSDPTSLCSASGGQQHASRRLQRSNSVSHLFGPDCQCSRMLVALQLRHGQPKSGSWQSLPCTSGYASGSSAGLYECPTELQGQTELSRAVQALRIDEVRQRMRKPRPELALPVPAFGCQPTRVPGSPKCSAV